MPALTRAAVAEVATGFVGRIRQTPPMYSALHHEGRRLYELAREGIEVPRAPRDVIVHAIEVDDVSDARVTLRVVCGKGTYVRTLAADLGDALGVGAAVEQLTRRRVGPFTLDEAVPWDVLERAHRLGAPGARRAPGAPPSPGGRKRASTPRARRRSATVRRWT